ncbi:MAG TPA: serine/threonine-protein kinase [Polyangiaceae bacterium]
MGARAQDPSLPVQSAPSQGDLIDGKYRVDRVLGQGAMGSVVAARHTLLDTDVAVKVLSSELLRHDKAVERFMREARAVARLKSEHVARVMDVGALEGGQPYIVMELLEGEDLDRRLLRTGAFHVEQAVDYALQALEAVAHAHAAGVVHRDLKPANLFLTTAPDGREILKVLDFGVAKLHERSTDGSDPGNPGVLTGEHAAIGSPGFMAPEQVKCARDIDERADVWGMGAVLYELLTGQAAFNGDSVAEIFGAILHTEPTPPRRIRPDIPAGLADAVMRCLCRGRELRFQSVAALAAAIEPYGSGALVDYAARIARTLERSTRVSDPGRSSHPPSVIVTPDPMVPRVVYTPAPPNAAIRSTPLRPPEMNTRETLLDAAGTSRTSVHPGRRHIRVVLSMAVAIVIGAGAAAFVRKAVPWSTPAESETPESPPPAASVPPPAPSPDPPAVEPTSSAPAPEESAPVVAATATTSAHPAKHAPPARHGATATPAKSRPGELPSVLDSPE